MQPSKNRVRQLHSERHSASDYSNVERESPAERSVRDVSLDVDTYEMVNSAYETLNADDIQQRNDDEERSQYDSLRL